MSFSVHMRMKFISNEIGNHFCIFFCLGGHRWLNTNKQPFSQPLGNCLFFFIFLSVFLSSSSSLFFSSIRVAHCLCDIWLIHGRQAAAGTFYLSLSLFFLRKYTAHFIIGWHWHHRSSNFETKRENSPSLADNLKPWQFSIIPIHP